MEDNDIKIKQKFELKSVDYLDGQYQYLASNEVLGSMALILPYKKRLGTIQYLVKRDFIPCWDTHADICGIAVHGSTAELEILLIEALRKETGYNAHINELKNLGVCACDRHTNTICHLYSIDLIKHNSSEEKLQEGEFEPFWASSDVVLESLDSQLIACYAKTQYLLL